MEPLQFWNFSLQNTPKCVILNPKFAKFSREGISAPTPILRKNLANPVLITAAELTKEGKRPQVRLKIEKATPVKGKAKDRAQKIQQGHNH